MGEWRRPNPNWREVKITMKDHSNVNIHSREIYFGNSYAIRNVRNTVSRALLRRRELTELTEFGGKLGELCEKNSVSSLCHTNDRLRGTH